MSIQPTISFSFSPTCTSFRCCCCSSDTDCHVYPKKNGNFKVVEYLSDEEIEKANERFIQIITRKIDPLPLDNKKFFDRLLIEEGLDLKITRENPLTKKRLDETIDAINKVLRSIHIY